MRLVHCAIAVYSCSMLLRLPETSCVTLSPSSLHFCSGRLAHRLVFEEKSVVPKDANVKNVDSYDIHDPRNPMTQRRREKHKDNKRRRKH